MSLELLPVPKDLTPRDGVFRLTPTSSVELTRSCPSGSLVPACQLADEMEAVCGIRPEVRRVAGEPARGVIGLSIAPELGPPEGYRLTIAPEAVSLVGNDAAGLYYGVQTLRQLLRRHAPLLPCLEISDAPDFAARGFYHDCTRGKVPTLETLFGLVETLAHYKLNQLQLYVEHTFAFRRHVDVWAGADPLTAEEILRLDVYCLRHQVELVPSFATFGHMYGFICTWRRQGLNELELESMARRYSWRDRMAHYTLDPTNPESLALVEGIIDEVAPLFSSELFNVCGDETMDLGQGRSRATEGGVGRVYLDFVTQVMALVRRHGKRPMFWGDILLQHPELISELPDDALALAWDYSADLTFGDPSAFARAGVPFYVCPGLSGWSRWLSNIDTAWKNITRLAKAGAAEGAVGMLTTDWGDDGHVNLLSSSLHGLVLGAAASWNVRMSDAATFDQAFSRLELGDPSGRAAELLWRLTRGSLVNWRLVSDWIDPTPDIPTEARDPHTGALKRHLDLSASEALRQYKLILETRDELLALSRDARPRDGLAFVELSCAAWGQALMHALLLVLQRASGRPVPPSDLTLASVADDLRRFERELSGAWHRRNRPSEYFRVRRALLEAAERLDRIEAGGRG
jgi:hypothetical protein